MKKILVPVDFSLQTETSCRYALELAKTAGAELILFHSFFDQVYFTDGGFSTSFESGLMLTDEIILDFYTQKESALKIISEELESSLDTGEHGKVKISCWMESGDPEVQIIKAIKVHHPDLVVMGSSGMGKKGIFSGSVAMKIIGNTDLPVIAVPALTETRGIKNVAYMSAFDSNDADVIRNTEDLLGGFNINLFILHILTGKEEISPGSSMSALAEALDIAKPGYNRSYHLCEEDENFEKLRQFLDDNRIDLIVFIPHKRNVLRNLFHQGITKKDLFLTHIPILAARPASRT